MRLANSVPDISIENTRTEAPESITETAICAISDDLPAPAAPPTTISRPALTRR